MQLVGVRVGEALVLAATTFEFLLVARFYGQMARREVRVAETQGLAVLGGAVFCIGAGLAVLSSDYVELIPLSLGVIGLGLFIGAYGMKLLRSQ